MVDGDSAVAIGLLTYMSPSLFGERKGAAGLFFAVVLAGMLGEVVVCP